MYIYIAGLVSNAAAVAADIVVATSWAQSPYVQNLIWHHILR